MATAGRGAALVTGASQGIGAAIARRLAQSGFEILLAARSVQALDSVRQEILEFGGEATVAPVDLADVSSIEALVARVFEGTTPLSVLVNCGGLYRRGEWHAASADDLDRLMQVNVSGAYRLTQALLPRLVEARGDVVFVNSSVVRGDGAGAAQFAATQRALTALADSLRAEVNASGVRVVSVYPGRTATPRQADIHEQEGRAYSGDRLLQPEDVAQVVATCVDLPETAEVTDLHVRPRFKT